MSRLQIIGGGQMGGALLGGLLDARWCAPSEVHVVDASTTRRQELVELYPALSVGDAVIAGVDAVLAVKPVHVEALLPALAAARPPRLLSVVAGIRTAVLDAALGTNTAVVRCMPNTPALVGMGASAIAAAPSAAAADIAWARTIVESVGAVEEVDEADLDAVTGLSGSGPAYVFLLAEALIDAAITEGLEPAVADRLTRQTLIGAATLLHRSPQEPAALRDNVTSPNGTTEAGLAQFEAAGFRDVVARVVSAASARSRELGR